MHTLYPSSFSWSPIAISTLCGRNGAIPRIQDKVSIQLNKILILYCTIIIKIKMTITFNII
jgi:hypothetical protein